MTGPFVGTAGWSIPKAYGGGFPGEGSHLERYARVLGAVEINSSFYRPHRPVTYARWAESVPEGFRFAVKVPRLLTHERRLTEHGAPLAEFLAQTALLGEKRGPLLIQLPPSLRFDIAIVAAFLEAFRGQYGGPAVFEPRHPTWFEGEGDALLASFEVARAAVDPAVVTAAAEPGGYLGLVYFRWHGSPQMYVSDYPPEALDRLEAALKRHEGAERWCVFDNTTVGAATGNALELKRRFRE